MKRRQVCTVPKSADSSPKEEGGDGHDASGGVRLARTIGFATGVNVLVGSMVGSGIFVSPGGVLRFVGGDPSSALLVWAGCGLLSLLGALCYAELGAAVPTTGGEYAYVRRAFGAPLAFLFAWTSVALLRPAMNSAVALTFAEYVLRPLFHGCPAPPAIVKCLAIASLLVVGILNCVRSAAREQQQRQRSEALVRARVCVCPDRSAGAVVARGCKPFPISVSISVARCGSDMRRIHRLINDLISINFHASSVNVDCSGSQDKFSQVCDLDAAVSDRIQKYDPRVHLEESQGRFRNSSAMLAVERYTELRSTCLERSSADHRAQTSPCALSSDAGEHSALLITSPIVHREGNGDAREPCEVADKLLKDLTIPPTLAPLPAPTPPPLCSMKWAMRALDVLTLLKMLALAIVSVGGLVLLASGRTHNPLGSFAGAPPSPAQIGESFYQGLWAYGGWNALNYATEELKDVHKNITRCIVVAVPLVTAFYVLVNISYMTVLTPKEIISSAAVAVTWGDRVLGSFSWIVPLSVAVSTFGSLNCSAFVMGRLNYAAAREGHALPLLAMLSVRHQTPTPAVAFSTLLSVAFVLPTDLIMLTNYFGFVTWLLVGLNCAGLLVLRYREPDLRRPYRVLWPVPVVVVLVCGYLVLAPIVSSPRYEYLFALLFVLAGFVFYVPFVHFKLRAPCLPALTCWLQLLLEVSPTVAPATCVDAVR
uniref:B(0,+)-type amino acid transporter 1-like n=1 Tax=Petromyzon marinus TaxID=7757 RepID=A0AAJ7WX76_PETMA|nr:b(0,+)-type amino acid transporter 1-like [Petromyzon marinus]